jgi:hypothetical protein
MQIAVAYAHRHSAHENFMRTRAIDFDFLDTKRLAERAAGCA